MPDSLRKEEGESICKVYYHLVNILKVNNEGGDQQWEYGTEF